MPYIISILILKYISRNVVYVSIFLIFIMLFITFISSKIQNKKAKVNSREYLLLKEDVFMRVGVALFFPLGKKLPQIVL